MADNDFPTVEHFQEDEVITANKLNTLADAAHYAESQVINANSTANLANSTASSVVELATEAKNNTALAQQAATSATSIASDAKALASNADITSKDALAKINSYVDTTNLVNLNTAQTITGSKTFTTPIIGTFQTHQVNDEVDLNNYQQDGKYFFSKAPQHAPFSKPAIVLIQSGVNQSITPNTQLVIQTIYDFENVEHPQVRTFVNNEWSNWQLLGGEINTAKLDKDNSFTGSNTFNKVTQFMGNVAFKATVQVTDSAQVQFDSPVNCNNTINANGGIKGTTAEFNDLPVPIQDKDNSNDLNNYEYIDRKQIRSIDIDSTTGISNVPIDPDTKKIATAGILTVKQVSNTKALQTFEDYTTGYVYHRYLTGSTWSDWILLTPYN